MMVFALIFSLHSGAYAEETPQAEIKLEEDVSQKAPAKEGEKEEDQTRKETEKPDEASRKDQAGEEQMEVSDENVADPISNQQGEETEPSEGEAQSGEGKPAGGEEQPKTDEGQPAEDGKKNPTPEDPKKPSKKAVDVSNNEEMKTLDEKINKTKDPKERAKLEKQYNEKYAKLLADTNKLDDSVLDRVKEKEKIDKYYELKDQYDAILEKLKAEDISSEDSKKLRAELDKLNAELYGYDIPRLLTEDEKKAQEDLADSVDMKGLKSGSSDKAEKAFQDYQDAKKDLEEAINPKKDPTDPEKLRELVDAYKAARDKLKEGISDGSIKPSYTGGNPELTIRKLNGGALGEVLDKNTYYIPDNTDLNLMVDIKKDDAPKKLTFTIRPIEKGGSIEGLKVGNPAFLNGTPVELTKNDDGSYSFTFNNEKTFGIAQLRLNVPGFKAALGKGFDLEFELNGVKTKKEFRITKKGYEDEAHLEGPGSETKEYPEKIKEIDAGKTEDSKVVENTDKVHDFFTYLKKSNTYIDDVLVNSASGESIPLTSVDITITVPKKQDGKFAEMIHKSGLKYHDLGNGKYQLKLDTKVFGGNLEQGEDGKLYLKDKEGKKTQIELSKEKITDVILENAGKRVYVDEKGEIHETKKEEYLEGENYKVQDNVLYEKVGGEYKQIGKFDENGRIEKGDKVYELKGEKLIHYDKVNVYEGKVVNTKDKEGNEKANPNLTPTPDGDQVVIESGEGDKKVKSYGGTIVENAIYNNEGKFVKNDGKYTFKTGNIIIGDDGQAREDITFDEKNIKEENGIKTVKVGDKTYRVVTNPVFNKDGYIIDGLTYAHGPSLVDKYGKRMKFDVTKNKDGTYTFSRKVIKNGKEDKETKTTGKDNISIAEEKEVIVDSINKIIDPSDDNKVIKGKYYYDGKKFKNFEPKEIELKKVSKETYTKDGKEVDVSKKESNYKGSLNPDDYYKAGDDFYVKKTQGSKDYYVSANPNSKAQILSVDEITKIVQTLGEDKDAKEEVTDESSIFDAVQNAKFGLRFPGFMAGKNIVYNVHADVKATYKDAKGKEKSIFTEKDKIKKADQYFTLKNSKSTETKFFKANPKELEKTPDYHFFNIFYRNSDDRKRDDLIKALLQEEAKSKKKEDSKENSEEKSKELTEDQRSEIKRKTARMALLKKIQDELGRLYDGAKFALDEKGNLVVLDSEGKETQIDRSLLWEIGFNNSDNSIFPENKDTEVIIEDHHLDNRLVYDQIIVNDTEANWKKLKEESDMLKEALDKAQKAFDADQSDANKKKLEDAKKAFEEKEFKGSKNYFYLDQIGQIQFGANPSYKEQRFAPLGDKFTLTGEEIIRALGNKDEETIEKGGIKYRISRDKKKGQVRISVINAFYKKNESYKKEDKNSNKFSSPVQEAYGEKIKKLNANLDEISTTEGLKKAFDEMIDGFVSDDKQKKELKDQFAKLMDDFDAKTFKNDEEKAQTFDKIKATLKAELEKLPLSYLDESKGKYKNDDFRFNSIRIALKAGIRLGGPLSPETNKKLGITSVVIPDVDIPYTDEYGKLMTNKYMYVKEEIDKIIKEGKKYSEGDLKDEDKYKEILREAYKRVNEKYKDKIKDLVEINDEKKLAWEKYSPVPGKSLAYDDLKSIKDKNGNGINPWYIGGVSADEKFKAKPGLKDSPAYKDLMEKKIDLAAYYMAKNGYDRRTYANKANYKLDIVDQAEGIFGKEDSSKKKSYYPTIGYIIDRTSEEAGLKEGGKEKGADDFGAEGKNDSRFELDYEPESPISDGENPKVEKSVSEGTVDIKGEEDKKVDFTIDVTVDKMTKGQKDLANALKDGDTNKPEEESKDVEYGPGGHYIYKNSVIIDILPEIFKLTKDSKVELNVDKLKLMANGANAKFDNEEEFENFKKSIKYFYTEDLDAEIARLEAGDKNDQKKAEILKKAKADSGKKFKDGEKIKAIIAYLPDFEAPHGSSSQFTFKLSNILIDKKAYKDYDDGVIGTDYTNKAGFGDKFKFYYGDAKVNISQGPDGEVNKYLQILDKDGKVLDKDVADGWFKGNAKLKFGDKFNYRIKYRHNSGIVQDPNGLIHRSELSIKDILAGVENGGLRPVLRGFVTSPDMDDFVVTYKDKDGNEYSQKDIEDGINGIKLSDITSLVIKSGDKGYEDGSTVNFIIPMEIPTIDAKIEKGKLTYIGKDGNKKIIGKASDFFNLKDLKNEKKDLIAENTVENSNTVKVYLDKNRFLRVFKEFFDQKGEKITENRPQVEFEIYQIELDKDGKPIKDEKGNPKKFLMKDKDGNPLTLVVNEKNNFTDIANNLPFYKKTVEVKEDGTVIEKLVKYGYEIEEIDAKVYDVEIQIVKDKDGLGFVMEAKNTKKPETPENPNESPEDPEEPDEPEKPGEPDEPENPDEPEDKEKDKPEEPSDKDKDKPGLPEGPDSPDNPNKPGYPGRPRLPKTGAITDFMSLYLSGLILLLAIIARKKVRE